MPYGVGLHWEGFCGACGRRARMFNKRSGSLLVAAVNLSYCVSILRESGSKPVGTIARNPSAQSPGLLPQPRNRVSSGTCRASSCRKSCKCSLKRIENKTCLAPQHETCPAARQPLRRLRCQQPKIQRSPTCKAHRNRSRASHRRIEGSSTPGCFGLALFRCQPLQQGRSFSETGGDQSRYLRQPA